jgi:hypothetical protein
MTEWVSKMGTVKLCMLKHKVANLKNNFFKDLFNSFLSLCMEIEGLSRSKSLQMRGKL